MSNHPYRSLPYPLKEMNQDDNNLNEISQGIEGLQLPPNHNKDYNNVQPSQGNIKNQTIHHLPSHLVPNNNLSPKFQSSPNKPSFSTIPYPTEEKSLPPYFDSKESVVMSPPSNPLSATSSVTNLNLNLDTLDNNNFKHQRNLSSSSSIFNDSSSVVDFNQNLIQSYLGSNSSNLIPRIKTLELYRKNARKSNDPKVLFQYAQYLLQTALVIGESSASTSPQLSPKNSKNKSPDNESDGLKKALLKEALHYLKKLSDKGYVEAQYLLGDAYSSGALDKIDNKDAFVLFQSAAKHGHVESAYRTSFCYEEGLGTGRDARKAVEYLKIAAAKNHPAAMYKLGVYSFYSRMGLPNDMNTKKMGIKWLTRATNVATELTAAAPFELGKLYFNGFADIVIQDKKYGLELFAQAAALGHIESSYILGKAYEEGSLVPQDANLSVHYYTQAALRGDPNAMLGLVGWYLVGSDPFLTKDENEAFEWAKRAALCNLPKAQFALANFYEKGIGCTKDLKEAQNWYIKAAENGDEKSMSRINDKELIKKIQKDWKKKPLDSNSATEKDCVIM
ncbi:unnamed protein product [Candida verbasci]|uniref:Uncharacterized protein n=1 Tax=Candida verbasci TaxID=1227364 RepID=A0A9W4XGU0_9ASCO|nr:unnamed protein product [Candida verbasci]